MSKKQKDEIFTVTNNETGKQVVINSDESLRSIQKLIDITSEEMYAKAEKEENPTKKKFMLMYAKRMGEIEKEYPNIHN